MQEQTAGSHRTGRAHEAELLRRYHERGDFGARDEIVECTMPLVHHVARRYANRGEQYEDVVQAGAIGLVKAVDRFDPDRGVSFTSFAVPNIAGEIRRHFRDKGSTMRLPRDVQERGARVRKAIADLEGRLQRPPTTAEIAQALELEVADVVDAMVAMQRQDLLSLDRETGEDIDGHDRHGTVDDGFDRVDDMEVLRNGMQVLQEREKRIVHLRFYGGLTQAEIAEQVGISQMHVSRLLRQALADMRRQIQADRTPSEVRRLRSA